MLIKLRPKLQEIWFNLSDYEKKQFNRHLKPYWEIFRHRKTTTHENALQFFSNNNKIMFLKSKHFKEVYIPKKDSVEIDCTGFGTKLLDLEIVKSLISEKLISENKLGNLETHNSPNIFFLGPINKYQKFENVAIPELRNEVDATVNTYI